MLFVVTVVAAVLAGFAWRGVRRFNPQAALGLAALTALLALVAITQTLRVVPAGQLTMQLEASVLFHLDPEQAAEVYKSLGPDYAAVILQPQFRSVTRGVTAQYEARALYTSEREQHAVASEAGLKLGAEGREAAKGNAAFTQASHGRHDLPIASS